MLSCLGMVKCKLGYPCVHSSHVQDGEPQCMDTHDDEFKSPDCPSMCSCRGTAIYCESFVNKSVQDFTAISAVNNDFASLHSLEQEWGSCLEKCNALVVLDISNITGWDIDYMFSIQNRLNEIHVLNISSNEV